MKLIQKVKVLPGKGGCVFVCFLTLNSPSHFIAVLLQLSSLGYDTSAMTNKGGNKIAVFLLHVSADGDNTSSYPLPAIHI